MPTIANLKARIGSYINRAAADLLSSTSEDLVLAAINDARRQAQRDHDFKMLGGTAFITINANGVDYMTECKTTPGGITAQLMRTIDGVWQYTTSVVGATTFYTRNLQMDFGTIREFKQNLPMVTASGETYSGNQLQQFVFLNGTKLCYNSTTDTTFMLDGIKWVDDLAGSETADIFVNYFSDWLLWASLLSLNAYLKDDQRVTISNQLLNKAWDSVRELDGRIANSGNWTSLD